MFAIRNQAHNNFSPCPLSYLVFILQSVFLQWWEMKRAVSCRALSPYFRRRRDIDNDRCKIHVVLSQTIYELNLKFIFASLHGVMDTGNKFFAEISNPIQESLHSLLACTKSFSARHTLKIAIWQFKLSIFISFLSIEGNHKMRLSL
jgi:hypothetical protein